MNTDTKRLNILAERYFAGLTSTAEEKELRELAARTADDNPTAAEVLAVMSFAAMSPKTEMAEAAPRRRTNFRKIGSVAAAAAVATGLLTLSMLRLNAHRDSDCLAYVDGRYTDNPTEVMAIMEADLSALGDAQESVDSEISSDLSIISDAINQSSTTEP